MEQELTKKQCLMELAEKHTMEVMALTGWDHDKARGAYRKALVKHGIQFADYIKYQLYEVPEENLFSEFQKRKNQADREAREQLRQLREDTIANVMNSTGWPYEEAAAKMDEAMKRTGCAASRRKRKCSGPGGNWASATASMRNIAFMRSPKRSSMPNGLPYEPQACRNNSKPIILSRTEV